MGSLLFTWDDVVVKDPCDSGRGDATDSTCQQEALSLVEGHISEQLSKDRVSVNRQGHRPAVLSDCICGHTGITACVVRLAQREGCWREWKHREENIYQAGCNYSNLFYRPILFSNWLKTWKENSVRNTEPKTPFALGYVWWYSSSLRPSLSAFSCSYMEMRSKQPIYHAQCDVYHLHTH